MNILTFFAHPDDETLAAGGYIKKLTKKGFNVIVVIPCTGITSRIDFTEFQHQEQLISLRKDTSAALRELGIFNKNIIFGNFSDNRADSHTLLDFCQFLEKQIEIHKPKLVITHHSRCTNIDHQYCHNAAVVATRPNQHQHIDLISAEVPSSTGYLKPTAWEPNLYIELKEDEMDAKLKSMSKFQSEARQDPHPRSPEVLRALAKIRGSESGFFMAEAFMTIRSYGQAPTEFNGL